MQDNKRRERRRLGKYQNEQVSLVSRYLRRRDTVLFPAYQERERERERERDRERERQRERETERDADALFHSQSLHKEGKQHAHKRCIR